MSFSTYFKKIRKEKGLTQSQLAEAIHVSNSAIRNIEKERSSTLQFETFCSLVDFVGKPMEQVAYDVFFSAEATYNYPISPLSKHYLASRFCKRCIISPAQSVKDKNGIRIETQGVFWASGSPYYRVLIEEIHRNKYLAAIKAENKTKKLMNLIFAETIPYDGISDQENIKELRFVLDGKNNDDRTIFNELKNVVISNLGNSFHISYVLFEQEKGFVETDSEKHYITIKKHLPDI